MSQDNSTPADTQAALEQDSSFASAFDLDAETEGSDAGGESITKHDPDFEILDSEGNTAGSGEAEEEGEAKDGKAKPEGEGEPEGDEGEGEPEPEADKPAKKQSGSARLKAQVAELKAKLAEVTAGAPDLKSGDDAAFKSEVDKRTGDRPKQEDFANFLDFETANHAYEADRRAVTREVRREVDNADRARAALADSQAAAAREIFAERLDAIDKVVPGSMAKIEAAAAAGKLNALPHVNEAVADSEKSALLTLHFAEHPEKLEALNRMPPMRALREIGILEAGLSLPKPKTTTAAPPVPSKAPRGVAPARNADGDLQSALRKMYGGK